MIATGDGGGGLPRIVTEPIGGGALARAAAAGSAVDLYEPRPRTAAEWRARAASVARSAGHSWLDALRPALGETFDGSVAAARLERSAGSGGVVVTTGQQPGLFGGPIYTWSKAISALALADELQRATGVPTAPVFWAATDDADFAEASVTHVAADAEVMTLRLARGAADGTPMSAVPLGDDVESAIAALSRAAGSGPFAQAWDLLRRAYLTPGETVGGAYVRLLRALLEPLGVAVLDASHAAVRSAAAPVLRLALRRAGDVERALSSRDAAIASAGYAVQVPSVAGLSLVFSADASGVKQRVPVAAAARLADDDASAAALGPNVLLRPVVERAILPTVAYVAGPGELAYFAQVGAVADALGAARPLAVPRWSCTIIERHVARALSRRGLEPGDLADPHAAEAKVARASMPGDLVEALATLRSSVHDGLDRVAAAVTSAESPPRAAVPPAAIDGARRSLDARLDRLNRRFLAAAKRAAVEAMHDVAVARANLYPEGKRQERSLNFLPLLARYGPALLDAMRAAAAPHAARLVGTDRAETTAGASASTTAASGAR